MTYEADALCSEDIECDAVSGIIAPSRRATASGAVGATTCLALITNEPPLSPVDHFEHLRQHVRAFQPAQRCLILPRIGIGQGEELPQTRDNSVNRYRYTARDGLTELAGDVRGRISLGGDLLLASVWDGTESRTQVLKFDSALDNGGALPIDIIEAGLAPEGYEHISIQAMSDNGRLLAGTAQDGEGRTHGWLLRLRDSCSL